MVYFYFKKAFDTVSHEKLVIKLREIGISGSLLKWISNYLSNRSFRVKVQNSFSSNKKVTSGVPQGSVLGPLLFLIYISDLPNFCKTENIRLKIFADDLKAYTVSENSADLQNFIDKLIKFAHIKGLKIAPEKCQVFYIGSKNPRITYNILNSKINIVEEGEVVRDLGIFFSSDLKWEKHIEIIAANKGRVLHDRHKKL